MDKQEKVKKPKSKLRKTIGWVVTSLFVCLFVAFSAFQIISNSTKKDNYGVPNFYGHQTLVVLTDSMEPEYEVGTAIFVKKVDPSTIEIGDDVTFYYNDWSSVVTHRVRNVVENENYDTDPTWKFKFEVGGINTDSDNCHDHGSRDCTYQSQIFTEEYLLGVVTGQSKMVGSVYKLVSSPFGLLLLLLIPCLYLIVTSVIDIFKAAKDEDEVVVAEVNPNVTNNDPSSLDDLSEEDKERLKKELLNELIGGVEDEKK